MGRRKIVKIVPEKEDYKWEFALDVDIDFTRLKRDPIAFLSGLGRSYFPEDPGFSKFALVYQPNIDDEIPPCTYAPPIDSLHGKPISKKSYGIGGLNGPRFAKNLFTENPSPDKYQREVGPELLNSHRRRVFPHEEVYSLPPDDPYVLLKETEEERQHNRQCLVSFGTNKSKPRFEKHHAYDTMGVGSYNIERKRSIKSITSSAFGRSPVTHELSTNIHCTCEKNQECIECGKSLRTQDFYRTKMRVIIPYPETRARQYLDKHFPRGLAHINLCNVCYYRALMGKSTNWPKGNKLRWMFKKTRTCSSMMYDGSTEPSAQKSDKKIVKRLQQKESILAKYYEDVVEESIFT